MKKFLLLFFFIPFFVISLNASASDVEDKLSRLEISAFNTVYSDDELSSRLMRLEKEYFGAKQSGNLSKRLDNLMKNAYYCDTPQSDEYSSFIYETPEVLSSKGFKGFLNKIKNEFDSGSFTGYTPPLQNGYYSDIYGNGSSSFYSPFSSPFYKNKFSRPFDNFRYDNLNSRRINPFNPDQIGVSHRPYSSFYRPYQPKSTGLYYPNRYYQRPQNIRTNIGTRVTLLD